MTSAEAKWIRGYASALCVSNSLVRDAQVIEFAMREAPLTIADLRRARVVEPDIETIATALATRASQRPKKRKGKKHGLS